MLTSAYMHITLTDFAMSILTCGLLALLVVGAWGHGKLTDPPNRSSCWREGFDKCVPNWTDNELSCGGISRQWDKNDGKCGVCGDPWDAETPRANEAGGKYGQGVIVRSYDAGSVIPIKVLLTASHFGWFEFRLCKNDDVTKAITHDCLNENLLVLENGSTRYPVTTTGRNEHTIRARLPPGLTCSQCVLQWKYHTGNGWGCDDTGCCTGCGQRQEEFYGCADIEIL